MERKRPGSPNIGPAHSGSAIVRTRERSGLRVSSAVFAPRTLLERHHHDPACVTVVLDGLFSEQLLGRWMDSRPGGVLAKPAGEPHRDSFGREGSRQIIVELAEHRVQSLPPGYFADIRHRHVQGAVALASSLARELIEEDDFSPLATEGLALELLALVGRARPLDSAPPPWLGRVLDLIHARMAAPPSLDELATEAGVGPDHLTRRFRLALGRTPADYGRAVRLDWAGRHLRETDTPIAAIALAAGFADQSHFTRWFRRYAGTTPAAFRARPGEASAARRFD